MALFESQSPQIPARQYRTPLADMFQHEEDIKTVRMSHIRHAGLLAISLIGAASAGYTMWGDFEPDSTGATPEIIDAVDGIQHILNVDNTVEDEVVTDVIQQFREATSTPEQIELTAQQIQWEKEKHDDTDARLGTGVLSGFAALALGVSAAYEFRWSNRHSVTTAKRRMRNYKMDLVSPLQRVRLVETAQGPRWSDQIAK